MLTAPLAEADDWDNTAKNLGLTASIPPGHGQAVAPRYTPRLAHHRRDRDQRGQRRLNHQVSIVDYERAAGVDRDRLSRTLELPPRWTAWKTQGYALVILEIPRSTDRTCDTPEDFPRRGRGWDMD